MRTAKLSAIILFCASILLVNGCNGQLEQLRIQNDAQGRLIDDLRSQLDAANVELSKLKLQLATAQGKGSVELGTLQEKIAALEEDIAKKNELIASMQQRLLSGGAALPVELSTLLEDFAKTSDMVEYDSERGIVKFRSDLLFDKGSDQVASSAVAAIKSLCGILNTQEGKEFDVLIAGHTDDIPIQKPATKEKHPTNWHLSVHRAISVLNVMKSNDIAPERMSVRGFGEFRPAAPNGPNKTGNEQNRRVEIYIIAKGT
ncbi:MAG: OmpA family protein [Sedimentisphaerales bacterium]|nr:OmpA family protein [Sedimentisphaerales bacterium]